MFDYTNSAATALKLLTNFGRDITHRKVSEGTYNTATGTVNNTNTDTIVKAADFSFKGNVNINENVQANDRYALVSAGVASIDVSDYLIIAGVTWNIVNVKALAPAGVNVLFTVHIRR